MVTALATVPGATGAQPMPPNVAMATATRSRRLSPICDELVAFHLGDTRAREAAWREGAAIAEIDDAVDLRRLTGGPTFPRERGILAGAVHEHVHDGADELGIALEGGGIVLVLDRGRPLARGVRFDLVREHR